MAPGYPTTSGTRQICRTAHTGIVETRYPVNPPEPKTTAHPRGSETVFLHPVLAPGQPISTKRKLAPGAPGRARVHAATRESQIQPGKWWPPRAVRRREQ